MRYKHPLEVPRSRKLAGIEWTGARRPCPQDGIHGDTHPMTWAPDNAIYMSAGDPNFAFFDGCPRHMGWTEAFEKPEIYPHMGGLDVEKLTGYGAEFGVEQLNTMPGLIGPGGNGAKPSGMLCVGGSLYLAAQNLLGHKPARHRPKCQHGSDATILRSGDFGKTWQPDIQPVLADFERRFYDRKNWKWTTPPEERTEWDGWRPMFPGALFGGPSFVQYGRDNADAPDDFVYAVSGDQWDNGTELRVGRVHRSRILEAAAWEWAAAQTDGSVEWTGRLEESRPVLALEGRLGLPEMVYLPSLRTHLLFTWGLHLDFDANGGSELTVLEADHPWGPFRLVYFEQMWDSREVCPYTPRLPLKWFDGDRLQGWLLYSGSWHTVIHYKPHVRPFRLILA